MSLPRSGSTDNRTRTTVSRSTEVGIFTREITLGEFLKWAGVTATGGQAKVLTRRGAVAVNGSVERRRGRRLGPGDRIAVHGREYRIVAR
jgi:ribosome-associated protein